MSGEPPGTAHVPSTCTTIRSVRDRTFLPNGACAAAPAGQYLSRRGVPPRRRGRAGLVRGQRGQPAAPGGTARAVPARVAFRGRQRRSSSSRCWPQRPSMAGPNRTCLTRSPGGRTMTFGSTPFRGGRLYPHRGQPGECAGGPGMPGPGPAPRPPSAITAGRRTFSGHLYHCPPWPSFDTPSRSCKSSRVAGQVPTPTGPHMPLKAA